MADEVYGRKMNEAERLIMLAKIEEQRAIEEEKQAKIRQQQQQEEAARMEALRISQINATPKIAPVNDRRAVFGDAVQPGQVKFIAPPKVQEVIEPPKPPAQPHRPHGFSISISSGRPAVTPSASNPVKTIVSSVPTMDISLTKSQENISVGSTSPAIRSRTQSDMSHLRRPASTAVTPANAAVAPANAATIPAFKSQGPSIMLSSSPPTTSGALPVPGMSFKNSFHASTPAAVTSTAKTSQTPTVTVSSSLPKHLDVARSHIGAWTPPVQRRELEVPFQSQSPSSAPSSPTLERRQTNGSSIRAASNEDASACSVCTKAVYKMEEVRVDCSTGKVILHKWCFRCQECNGKLSLGSYAAVDGMVYCKPHFKQLFSLKGNYNEGFGTEQRKKAFIKDAVSDDATA